jgi:hypothetical protein
MAKTFQSVFRFMLPSWITNGDGGKVWAAITNVIDDNILAMRESLYAQLPSKAQPDALEKIGVDRALPRGKTETTAHYVARLRGWRFPFGHRVRGSDYGLLDQLRQYFGGADRDGIAQSSMFSYTMDQKGSRGQIRPTGDLQFDYGFGWDWDGAGVFPNWARFWVILDRIPGVTRGPTIGDPTLWGGAVGPASRGYTIGQAGVTPDDIAAIRNLVLGPSPWKPAGTRAEWVIVSFNGAFPVPTGDWQNHAARNPAFRYWSLLP